MIRLASLNKKYSTGKKISKAVTKHYLKYPGYRSVMAVSQASKTARKKERHSDALSRGYPYTVYSYGTVQDVYDIVVNKELPMMFEGGGEFGNGFYGSPEFEFSQDNGGRLLLEADVYHMNKFFYTDYRDCNKVFRTGFTNFKESCAYQLRSKLDDSAIAQLISTRGHDQTSEEWLLEGDLYEKLRSLGFRGLVYFDVYQGERTVAWYVEDIKLYGVSEDGGQTWVSPDEYLENYTSHQAEKLEKMGDVPSGEEDILKEGWFDRVLELKDRYVGDSDLLVNRKLWCQFSSIKDVKKLEVIREALKGVYGRDFGFIGKEDYELT